MNHLIIYAHPNPKSFCMGITETVKKTSAIKGHDIKVRDLYEIGFDSILKPSDFEAFGKGAVPEDVKEEQEHIKWADVMTVVYPIWWANMPAILKGYIDRVFSYGFAYEYNEEGPVALLKGKKVIVFNTTGSPNEVYEAIGMHEAIKRTTDTGIFNFTGIDVLEHTFFGAVPHVEEDTRKSYLHEVDRIVNKEL